MLTNFSHLKGSRPSSLDPFVLFIQAALWSFTLFMWAPWFWATGKTGRERLAAAWNSPGLSTCAFFFFNLFYLFIYLCYLRSDIKPPDWHQQDGIRAGYRFLFHLASLLTRHSTDVSVLFINTRGNLKLLKEGTWSWPPTPTPHPQLCRAAADGARRGFIIKKAPFPFTLLIALIKQQFERERTASIRRSVTSPYPSLSVAHPQKLSALSYRPAGEFVLSAVRGPLPSSPDSVFII